MTDKLGLSSFKGSRRRQSEASIFKVLQGVFRLLRVLSLVIIEFVNGEAEEIGDTDPLKARVLVPLLSLVDVIHDLDHSLELADGVLVLLSTSQNDLSHLQSESSHVRLG